VKLGEGTLIVLSILCILMLSGCTTPSFLASGTALEDIVKNPEKYYGKEVEIEGVIHPFLSTSASTCCFHTAYSRDGKYMLSLENVCFGRKKWMNTQICNFPEHCSLGHSEVYSFKGNVTMKEGKPVLIVYSYEFKECL